MHEKTLCLPPSEIQFDPNQPRRRCDDEAIFLMAQSIKAEGVLQPVRVRKVKSGYMLVAGERRVRGAIKAGLAEIPCIVEGEGIDDTRAFERALIENCVREDLSAVEQASAFEKVMHAKDWTGAELAAHLHINPAKVSRALSLLKLPAEIRAQVESGAISPAKAYELAKVADAALQRELAARAAGGATRDAIAGAARSRRRSCASASALSRVVARLPGGRSVTVQGAIATLDDFIMLAEEVIAKARKARTQGVEVATFMKMLRDQAKQPASA